jgi:predicted CoA-binding protein
MENYKTVVLGATTNPARYAYRATAQLQQNNIEVVPVGIRKGQCAGIDIINHLDPLEGVHTVTLYLNPTVQQDYEGYILSLRPKRVIFNPGTENPRMYKLLRDNLTNIQIETACTLVMLSVGNYTT